MLWGTATVDQHQERIDIYLGNVYGNAEGAAMHMKALTEMARRKASCLNNSLGGTK